MRRLFPIVAILVIAIAALFFFLNFEVQIRRRGASGAAAAKQQDQQFDWKDPHSENTIRVASFNIEVFGTTKASKPHVMDALTEIARRFDVLAIQEIRSRDQTVIPRFIDRINATGVRYDYVLGPALGRTNSKEQYAFIYNTATVEVDYNSVYTVADPYDRLHREPLVGMFRARGPEASEAFTFKLVNMHTDPDDVQEELNAMDDVYRAVLNDGEAEDDVIILGDLNTGEHKLYELGEVPGITCALSGTPTNTRRTRAYDNIVYHAAHTTEFNGRAGVVDLVRAFNVTTDQAEEISDHLPIWAEFSIYEGGGRGRVAGQPASTSRQ